MSAPVYTSPPMMLETTTSTSPQTLLVPLERLEPWRDGGKPLSEVVLGIPEPVNESFPSLSGMAIKWSSFSQKL